MSLRLQDCFWKTEGKTEKYSNKQTSKQTNKQTNKTNSQNLNWSGLSKLRLKECFEKTDRINIQTYKQTNKQTDRQDEQANRRTYIHTEQTNSQNLNWSRLSKLRFSDRFEKTDRQTDRQKECHTDRQDKQTDIWT
jgi:hypothetical protein